MCMGGGGRQAQAAANEARMAEEQRRADVQAAVGRVNDTFGQFDDNFFGQRERAYSEWATPQVSRDYDRARRELIFALANTGLTNSSSAARRLGDLETEYGQQRLAIADRARGYAQQARSDVESTRGNLIAQATATGDASIASNSALNEASRLSVAQPFEPLGQVFQNVTAGLGTAQRAAEVDRMRGGAKLFNAGTKSGRVVN